MLTIASLLITSTLSVQPSTTVVLGHVERDLTGDGKPETLCVVGVGPTRESLDVTLQEHRTRLEEFGYAIVPLGWSALAGRFYRLLDCC